MPRASGVAGILLSARVPDGLEDQATDVLERYDPVDVDERAESWRQSGWAGYQAPAPVRSALRQDLPGLHGGEQPDRRR